MEGYLPRLDDEIVAFYRNSRAAYNRGDIDTAEKWYRRLRSEHCVELFYECEMPEIWRAVHPLGSVIGRAEIGDYFCFYHGCGVGSDVDGNKPRIGEGVVLFPGAKVLGNVTLGNNVWVTANTVISGTSAVPVNIPDNSVVFPRPFSGVFKGSWGSKFVDMIMPGHKKTRRSVKKTFFGVD